MLIRVGEAPDVVNNEMQISDSDRKYHWPLGRRPDDHPGLRELR